MSLGRDRRVGDSGSSKGDVNLGPRSSSQGNQDGSGEKLTQETKENPGANFVKYKSKRTPF